MQKKIAIIMVIVLLVIASVGLGLYIGLLHDGSNRGLIVGNYFTYSITGVATLQSPDAKVSPSFENYNLTDYYKITITGINSTKVTMQTAWRFINGTEVDSQQTIDLSSGQESTQNEFWAIYATNLKVGDLLHPTGNDGLKVNASDTKTYANSIRERNYWFTENQTFDVNDLTNSTLRNDFVGVYFDKQTGMLDTLNRITAYNNPLKNEAITWKLVDSNAWPV